MIPKGCDEIWLEAMLKRAKVFTQAFDGLTTHEDRKNIFRAAIRGSCVENAPATPDETFAELFQRTYAEQL